MKLFPYCPIIIGSSLYATRSRQLLSYVVESFDCNPTQPKYFDNNINKYANTNFIFQILLRTTNRKLNF